MTPPSKISRGDCRKTPRRESRDRSRNRAIEAAAVDIKCSMDVTWRVRVAMGNESHRRRRIREQNSEAEAQAQARARAAVRQMRPLMSSEDGDGGLAVMKLHLKLGCIEGGSGCFSAIWRVWRGGTWGRPNHGLFICDVDQSDSLLEFWSLHVAGVSFSSLLVFLNRTVSAERQRGFVVAIKCRVPGKPGFRNVPSNM